MNVVTDMAMNVLKPLKSQFKLFKARAVRDQSQARFIGVTGSSAKSTTVALLSHILGQNHKTYRQILSNGLPALAKSLAGLKDNTDYCVNEVGLGGPNQMQAMAELLRPDVTLITMIQAEHYKAFQSLEAIAAEKALLAEAVAPDGVVFLNADDKFTAAIAGRLRARVVTFGRSDNADYQVVDVKVGFPNRLQMKVRWSGGDIDLRPQFIAGQFWLSTVAAFAVAIEEGIDPGTAAQCIASYKPMIDRCGVLEIPGGPTFILDTVKAALPTLPSTFDLLARGEFVRKRIVMGHISDSPGNAKSKYRYVYKSAREIFDEVIFIGAHAHRSGASKEDRQSGRFKEFNSVEAVADYIHDTATPGEVIVLKGAKLLHLERIALSFTAKVACWENKCGRAPSCFQCGCYSMPFGAYKNAYLRRKRHKKPASHSSGYVDELHQKRSG